jgi:1-acyl-sn-glycerol-3-phosphate acyltransferase
MNTSQILRNVFILDFVIDLRAVFKQMWFEAGRTFAKIYAWLMFKMDVRYQARIAPGPKILAANHPSTIDPVMMTTLVPEPVSILILETLFKVPLFGASLKFSGHIRVNACNGKASLDEGLRRLQEGDTLGIFPEGVITPTGSEPLRAHTGVARLAIASGKPVIPIGIYLDPRYICRTESKVKGEIEIGTWYFHGPYAMTVGEPMTFSGDAEDRDYVRGVAEQIMQRVAVLTAESAWRVRSTHRIPVSSWVFETAQRVLSFTRWALGTI